MTLIKSKEYNNISFEPPLLKKGERAIFRSAFGSGNKFKSDHIMGKNEMVTTINDPEKGAVEIAFVASATPDGRPPKLGTIEFLKRDRGAIHLSGDNPMHQRQYAFMKLADFNGSKENRDDGKPIYYYEVDQSQERAKRLDDAGLLLEATKYGLETPVEQLKQDLIALGQNAKSWPDDMVRDKAINFYKAGSIKKTAPKTESFETKVRELFEAGIIRWDNKELKMCNDNSEVYYEVPGLIKSTSDKAGAIIAHAKKNGEFMEFLKKSLE